MPVSRPIGPNWRSGDKVTVTLEGVNLPGIVDSTRLQRRSPWDVRQVCAVIIVEDRPVVRRGVQRLRVRPRVIRFLATDLQRRPT